MKGATASLPGANAGIRPEILSPSYIVSSIKLCIIAGAVMDPDHWATYRITLNGSRNTSNSPAMK
jgi:hypothetical protein